MGTIEWLNARRIEPTERRSDGGTKFWPTLPPSHHLTASLLALLMLLLAGCATRPIESPLQELANTEGRPERYMAAMAMLDRAPTDPAYIAHLHGLIWRPGFYTIEVREAALERLVKHDQDGLKRTIRQRLPNMGQTMWPWLSRLSEIIAERGWDDLSPALVSSWARPTALVRDEEERPEYKALSRLHGKDGVVDAVFQLFIESNTVAEQFFRTRCWELMLRLGERNRLIALLSAVEVAPDDAMLIDLRAGAAELGIIPVNREEILWLRSLRKPQRAEFWSQAVQVVAGLSDDRRAEVELRDLPIIVAAHRHEPELLDRTHAELYESLQAYLRGQRHHSPQGHYAGAMRSRDRLHEFRGDLTWGDLAAMLMAVRAFSAGGMVEHLFDFAERDRLDRTTEYGGVIALDDRGEFELLEFPPRIREHDHKFIAPQEMFDAGYTALFHFHYHAQKYYNASHAGPGLGDLNYADNTRANCLVFTFISPNALNMDYYRHGRVVVDLGEIRRP